MYKRSCAISGRTNIFNKVYIQIKNKKIYQLVRIKLNYPSGFFAICICSESDAQIKNVFLLAFCVYAQNPRSKQE